MKKKNVRDLSAEDREQIISMLSRISNDIASNTTIQKIINGTSFTKLTQEEAELVGNKKKVDKILSYFKKVQEDYVLNELYNEVFGED